MQCAWEGSENRGERGNELTPWRVWRVMWVREGHKRSRAELCGERGWGGNKKRSRGRGKGREKQIGEMREEGGRREEGRRREELGNGGLCLLSISEELS